MKRRRSRDRPKNNAAEIIIAIVIVITLFALVAQIGSAPTDWTNIQASVPDAPGNDNPGDNTNNGNEEEKEDNSDLTNEDEWIVTTERIPFPLVE